MSIIAKNMKKTGPMYGSVRNHTRFPAGPTVWVSTQNNPFPLMYEPVRNRDHTRVHAGPTNESVRIPGRVGAPNDANDIILPDGPLGFEVVTDMFGSGRL